MRKLMLATVSSMALGLAGFGVAYAQTPANPDSSTPSATTPATPGTSNPNSSMDQGSQANQATPGTQGMQPDQGTQGAMNTQGTQSDQGMQANQNMSAQATPSRTDMRQAQQELRTAGLYKGRIDGRTGPRTRRAIMAFQQQHNLSTTGKLDQQTLSALQNGRS